MSKKIELTQCQIAIVDDADFEWLNQHKWYADKIGKSFYAVRNILKSNGERGKIKMHQVLIGNGINHVDHIDGNGLNNTRTNLRLATRSQNQHNAGKRRDNQSGFKGVSWHKDCNKWLAQIRIDGKRIHLGLFATPEEAARAYDRKAIELFGEYSKLNFDEEQP